MNADKETTNSLKKERSGLTKKLEDEKEKNRLAEINIEEERSARKTAESNMRDYQKRAESNMRDYQKRAKSLKGRRIALQSELKIQEEELMRTS